jgi:5'-3' exonuclease
VVRLVQPRAGIYLAIDGVVPMAKMRQQRLRRFKSVWLKQREQRSGSWDTNAITPGTVFMQRLHAGL